VYITYILASGHTWKVSTHTCIYIYTYMHTYIYIYIYTYIYVYITCILASGHARKVESLQDSSGTLLELSCRQYKFSKVSSLLNLLYKITLELTIENFYPPWAPPLPPIQILNSQLAAKFTTSNDYRADLWEFVLRDPLRPMQILKSQLNSCFI